MSLRNLARKLSVPATTALQSAWSRHVSPAAGSRPLASSPPQSGDGSRAANRGAKRGLAALRELQKRNRYAARDYAEAARYVETLPRRMALSAGGALLVYSTLVAYVFGAFNENKKYFKV